VGHPAPPSAGGVTAPALAGGEEDNAGERIAYTLGHVTTSLAASLRRPSARRAARHVPGGCRARTAAGGRTPRGQDAAAHPRRVRGAGGRDRAGQAVAPNDRARRTDLD